MDINNAIEIRQKYLPVLIKRNKNNGDLYLHFINKDVKVRIYGNSKKSEDDSLVNFHSINQSEGKLKRYSVECYIEPRPVPCRYSESLFLNIGSTKKTYEETVFLENEHYVIRWSETMKSQVNTFPKAIVSEAYTSIDTDDVQFITLEPQQLAASVH